ncbi:MAG: hypothetical protein ACYSUY_13415 [Planctomycetota bacterium]|jgi:hypothetical protein
MEYKLGDNVTMKSKVQILWIDDFSQRKKQATDLKDTSGMNVKFIPVRGLQLDEVMTGIINEYDPEMVILDHILDKTSPDSWTRLGSTLAGFLREKWEKCPVFGITAVKKLGQIDIERYAYDELIEGDRFSEYVRYIPNVVEGFKKCTKVKSIEEWIDLLKSPKDETERIKGCMAHDAKTDFEKKGFANRVYRWFRTKFYKMPGFLFDSDWVATFAGVKKEAVEKYLKHFKSAKYDGVFNDPDHPRWWKAKLYEVIYGKCKDENAAYRGSQDVANEVLRVKKQDRSKCYVCGGEWPETVAYVDESEGASTKQMHLGCTIAHPLYRYEPMFEEMRVMKGE